MDSLTVATYNVRHAGMDDGPDSWERRRPGVLDRIRAADPDVLCLQESAGEQHEEIAVELSDYRWTGVAEEPGSGEHNPIGVDPRLSIAESETTWLSETRERGSVGWDGAHARVLTEAHLRDPATDRELVVYNTHLDHVGRRARGESVALLRERIEGLDADRPVVVAGDFNAGPGDDAYERMRNGSTPPALTDARLAASDVSGPETTLSDFEALRPGRRFDHVFLTPGFAVERYAVDEMVVDGRYPSDHLPVVVGLSYRAEVDW